MEELWREIQGRTSTVSPDSVAIVLVESAFFGQKVVWGRCRRICVFTPQCLFVLKVSGQYPSRERDAIQRTPGTQGCPGCCKFCVFNLWNGTPGRWFFSLHGQSQNTTFATPGSNKWTAGGSSATIVLLHCIGTRRSRIYCHLRSFNRMLGCLFRNILHSLSGEYISYFWCTILVPRKFVFAFCQAKRKFQFGWRCERCFFFY